MKLPPRLLTGTLVSTVGRIIGTVLSVVTIGVVTRSVVSTVGVSGYGTYATIFAILNTLAVIADGGLYLSFTRYAATVDPAEEARVLRRMLRIRVITYLLVVGVATSVLSFLPYAPLVRTGVLLGSVGIGSQLVTQLLLGVFQKRLRMSGPAVGEVAGRATTLVVAIGVAGTRGGILAFVLAFVLGAVVTLVWNLVVVVRLLPESTHVRVAPARGRQDDHLWTDTWPLALLLICSLIIFRADSLMLSLLRPPEDLGWYALPYKVLESLLFFPAMIGGLLFPTLSHATTRATLDHFRETVAAATHLFLLLAIPIIATLVLAAPWIIRLLGGDAFAPSVGVLRILAVALGALFFGNLYGNSAIALGAQRSLLVAAATIAVMNVGMNLFVIPRFSFSGAAWTTLCTETLSAVTAGAIVLRRVSRVRPGVDQPRRNFASLCGLPSSIWLPSNWHVISAGGAMICSSVLPLRLEIQIPLALLVYVGTLRLLGVWSVRQLRDLLRAQRLSLPRS